MVITVIEIESQFVETAQLVMETMLLKYRQLETSTRNNFMNNWQGNLKKHDIVY